MIPSDQTRHIRKGEGRGVVGFNGAKTMLTDTISLRCACGSKKWENTFYVVEKSAMPRFGLLLGKPSLQAIGLWSVILDFKRRSLK